MLSCIFFVILFLPLSLTLLQVIKYAANIILFYFSPLFAFFSFILFKFTPHVFCWRSNLFFSCKIQTPAILMASLSFFILEIFYRQQYRDSFGEPRSVFLRIRFYCRYFLDPDGTNEDLGSLSVCIKTRVDPHYCNSQVKPFFQCFGSIFIESGSSKKSQSGSIRTLNPDPDPSYFLTLSEQKYKLLLNYKTFSSKEVN